MHLGICMEEARQHSRCNLGLDPRQHTTMLPCNPVSRIVQGHLHFLEDNYVGGIHFITGGAVCSGWWRHKYHGLEEGFLDLVLTPEKISWKYIDYGWDPEP